MCKLMKEEKLANKNWGVTELFQKLFRKKAKKKPKHWSSQTNYRARAQVMQSCSRFLLGRACAESMRTNNGHECP